MFLNISEISKISLFWTFWKRNWLTLASWAPSILTLFSMGGFSYVTSTNVRLAPKTFWAISSASPKLLNWNQKHPSKNRFFWLNPYKIKVMLTSLIVMLELPNFRRMTTFTIWFESRDKILLVASWTEIMTSQPLYQNVLTLRRHTVANFADIVKISTMFIKKTFKNSKKLKELEIMYSNAIYISISRYSKICWFLVKKCWYQQNSSGMSRDLYIFSIFFG